MRLKKQGALLALLLCCGNAAAAELDCGSDNPTYSVVDAFDPGADPAVRQKALQGLQSYAHCPGSWYSLGVLYRHGADLPGNLIQKDSARARDYLIRSAEDGYLLAYADLAEMALKEKQPREAMKWTQIYLYYTTTRGSFDPTSGSFDRSGYNAALLSKAESAWKSADLPRQLIGEDLNEYLKGHKSSVSSAVVKADAESAKVGSEQATADGLRIKYRRTCHADPRWAGYAMYLVEVHPDGRIGRIVLENFSPRAGIGKDLIGCAGVLDYYPFRGAEPLVARIPVIAGFQGPQIKIKRK